LGDVGKMLNSIRKIGDEFNGHPLKAFKRTNSSNLSSNELPLLDLPDDFKIYTWTGVTQSVDEQLVPATGIDELLTEYSAKQFQTLFTVEFIEFVDNQFNLFRTGFENNKFNYAVNLYLTICERPLIIFGSETEKILSHYFYNPIDPRNNFDGFRAPFGNLNKIFNISNLDLSLKLVEGIYSRKLVEATFKHKMNFFKITKIRAESLLASVNREMEKDINAYFVNSRARALTVLPNDIKNDSRFIASMNDASWNDYDEVIKREVSEYNRKFGSTPGYVQLDWRLVKAMVWTEILAGPKGNSEQWSRYPLQIGRFSADPGAEVIRNGRENSDLITSPKTRKEFQGNITGKNNIRAGVAYLYARAIRKNVEYRTRVDDSTILIYEVKTGDTVSKLLNQLGTTKSNILKNSNLNDATVKKLKPGQKIRYQKAHAERFISGWLDWTSAVKDYNGGGDPNYMVKVERAYKIIKSRSTK